MCDTNYFDNFLKIHGINNLYQKSNLINDKNIPVRNIAQALTFDRSNYLVNDVLAITDTATMAHGLEARVPFLHDEVVEIAETIPIGEKLQRQGKEPLRQLLIEYGGKAFTRRPKMGFGLPMADLLRQPGFPLWSLLEEGGLIFEYLDEPGVRQMKKEHLAGKKDWNMQLWSILVFSNWLRKNFA